MGQANRNAFTMDGLTVVHRDNDDVQMICFDGRRAFMVEISPFALRDLVEFLTTVDAGNRRKTLPTPE